MTKSPFLNDSEEVNKFICNLMNPSISSLLFLLIAFWPSLMVCHFIRGARANHFDVEEFMDVNKINGNLDDIHEFVSYSNEIVKKLAKDPDKYIKLGRIPRPAVKGKFDTNLVCRGCMHVVQYFRDLDLPTFKKAFNSLVSFVCSFFMTKEACDGMAKNFVAVYGSQLILRFVDPKRTCPFFYLCDPFYEDWTFDQFINETLGKHIPKPLVRPTRRSTYKLIHLSDIHIDMFYKENSATHCEEKVCCRTGDGNAGYWGSDAKCDLPTHTAGAMFDYIAKNFPYESIVWTGDNAAHDIYTQERHNQTLPTEILADMIEKKLHKDNVTIFATFGNHECFPCNTYDYFNTSIEAPILEGVTKSFSPFIKDPKIIDTLRQNGFYSQRDVKHALKVISINTQACNNMNWILLQNPTDPGHMLAWLHSELLDSEGRNESVWIIGHIAPGLSDCFKRWAKRYNVIIERFSHIVRGQFFGHTHYDHYQIQRSVIDNSLVGIIHISPSLTTEDYQLPSFKVFEIDTDTNIPVNWEVYWLNLTASTDRNVPVITKAYDFLTDFCYAKVDWETYEHLADQIAQNVDVAKQFMFYHFSGASKAHHARDNINRESMQAMSCALKSANYELYYNCLGKKDFSYYYMAFFEMMQGEWFRERRSKVHSASDL